MSISLREALKSGKLEQFIKEHSKDEPASKEQLDKLLNQIVQPKARSKARKTSSQGGFPRL